MAPEAAALAPLQAQELALRQQAEQVRRGACMAEAGCHRPRSRTTRLHRRTLAEARVLEG